jgi:hypothetical protein
LPLNSFSVLGFMMEVLNLNTILINFGSLRFNSNFTLTYTFMTLSSQGLSLKYHHTKYRPHCEVLTAMYLKIKVSWNVMCSLHLEPGEGGNR